MTLTGQLRLAVIALVLLSNASQVRADLDVQVVTSPKGVSAWLIEDYTLPIVAVRFGFKGGSRSDPVGKSGLAYLMSGLLDEGASELRSAAFQRALDAVGAELSFFARRTYFAGSLRYLRGDDAEAFELLRLAVNAPRFDREPVERIRQQVMYSLHAQQSNPEARANLARSRAIYRTHPYARNRKGTIEELSQITRQDLEDFRQTQFVKVGLHVAVVGAISADELAGWLDTVFGDLPAGSGTQLPAGPEPQFGETLQIPAPRPSTAILLTYPGIPLTDPDFPAALALNHILGGASFSSRLFEALRKEKGLVYGVSSGLDTDAASPQLVISTQARNDRVGETLSVIEDELVRLAEGGPKPQELKLARSYLAGSFLVRNFHSSKSTAETLLDLQFDGRPPDYLTLRRFLFDKVSAGDIRRLAAFVARTKPNILLVGPGDPTR